MGDETYPTFDLRLLMGPDADSREHVRLAEAFTQYGFILLEHHGINIEEFTRAYGAARELFALPSEVKSLHHRPELRGLAGYLPGDPNETYRVPSERTEMWQIQRELAPGARDDDFIPPTPWPDELSALRDVVRSLFGALDRCSMAVLGALTSGLLGEASTLPELARDGWAILRLMRYPPRSTETPVDAPRASPHDDVCLLTLYTGGTREGLEVRMPDGRWQRVGAGEHHLLIGAGTMLQHWSNGMVRPATHRVVYDPTHPGERYATPFFVLPRPEADVGPDPRCVERSQQPARYERRSAAQLLGERTGWGPDPATRNHARWRHGSPNPAAQEASRVEHPAQPFLKVRELDAASLTEASLGDAIERLYTGREHLYLIRGAFSERELARVAVRLERNDPALLRESFPERFRAHYRVGNLDMSGEDLSRYFEGVARYDTTDAAKLWDSVRDPTMRIRDVFSRLASNRAAERPRGPGGRAYLPISIKELLPGGFIPPHCECEQLQRPPYAHLRGLLAPDTLLSFYAPIGLPDGGGELAVYSLTWEKHQERGLSMPNQRTEVHEVLAQYARTLIRPRVGDLLIFDGGRFFHEVLPVTGSRTRWTMGGFAALSADRSRVYCWA